MDFSGLLSDLCSCIHSLLLPLASGPVCRRSAGRRKRRLGRVSILTPYFSAYSCLPDSQLLSTTIAALTTHWALYFLPFVLNPPGTVTISHYSQSLGTLLFLFCFLYSIYLYNVSLSPRHPFESLALILFSAGN